MPKSTFTDPQEIIADLRRELAECRAAREKAERLLDERTIERDEALAQQTADRRGVGGGQFVAERP